MIDAKGGNIKGDWSDNSKQSSSACSHNILPSPTETGESIRVQVADIGIPTNKRDNEDEEN